LTPFLLYLRKSSEQEWISKKQYNNTATLGQPSAPPLLSYLLSIVIPMVSIVAGYLSAKRKGRDDPQQHRAITPSRLNRARPKSPRKNTILSPESFI
jgi:hypothetical protein